MISTLHAQIQKSPFKNVYWFARYLLNTDQYGALGRFKESQLLELVTVLENLATQENFSTEEKFLLLKATLLKGIKNLVKPTTKTYILALNLVQQLDKDIKNVEDVIIFFIAIKYVVEPKEKIARRRIS